MVFLLLKLEEVVVIAALLAVVLGHHIHGFHGARRNQGDSLHVFIEPFFQIAHPRFDVFPLRFFELEELVAALERHARFEQIVEGHDAAPNQIKDPRLEPFGPVIFQVFLDGSNVSLEVMHVSFKWLVIMFS